MKISNNWLKDYCPHELPAHELADKLSMAGLNVDTCEPVGGDHVLDVEVTANRPDCLSHLGMAREVAAHTALEATRPCVDVVESPDHNIADYASVQVDDPELCPHYTARVVLGVKLGPSPDWIQTRLNACGIRPISNIVDITNYVMLESGQPLHAFDLARVAGGKIIVRAARAGEKLTIIDGTELTLTGKECVIADETHAVALAGVMGGIDSEICDTTKDVLVESARFNPPNIRRTARGHGLGSESSYRFERGVDPQMADWASRRACQMLIALCDGTLATGVAEVGSADVEMPEVELRMARLALVLGLEVPLETVLSAFRGLGLEILADSSETVRVRVPSWRPDLTREIDLIEEVARVHGYDKLRETLDMPVRAVTPTLAAVAERKARHMVAGQGFCEVMTYSLVPPEDVQLIQPWHTGEPMTLRNPVSADHSRMKLTNMANILKAKRFNETHGTPRVDLFELGTVYLPQGKDEQPDEKVCLTLLTDRNEPLRVLKGILANLVEELSADVVITQTPGCAGPFAEGTALSLHIGDEFLGCAGVVSDAVADALDVRTRPALMELDFAKLAVHCRLDRPLKAVPTYPGTARDLAIIVGEDVLWADIEKCVRSVGSDALESIEFLNIYRGDHVATGKKSVAFSLTFRLLDRTITAEEAEQARAATLAALQSELQAELR